MPGTWLILVQNCFRIECLLVIRMCRSGWFHYPNVQISVFRCNIVGNKYIGLTVLSVLLTGIITREESSHVTHGIRNDIWVSCTGLANFCIGLYISQQQNTTIISIYYDKPNPNKNKQNKQGMFEGHWNPTNIDVHVSHFISTTHVWRCRRAWLLIVELSGW